MSLLDRQEITSFKANGFLVLEEFLDSRSIHLWRRQIAEHFGVDPRKPAEWEGTARSKSVQSFQFSPEESAPSSHKKIVELLHQLGEAFVGNGYDQLIVTWPRPAASWKMPARGHIDLSPRSSGWRFALGLTMYLYEVPARGGGTVFWPESHRTVFDYFRQHPEHFYGDVDGGMDHVREALGKRMTKEPWEFVGGPGTVCLWHGLLYHSASINMNGIPRVGVFNRWGQEHGGTDPRWEDMWASWSI